MAVWVWGFGRLSLSKNILEGVKIGIYRVDVNDLLIIEKVTIKI